MNPDSLNLGGSMLADKLSSLSAGLDSSISSDSSFLPLSPIESSAKNNLTLGQTTDTDVSWDSLQEASFSRNSAAAPKGTYIRRQVGIPRPPATAPTVKPPAPPSFPPPRPPAG
eukprot:CAMPEP_0184031242 /NCGR_PEP_ID=MMETSP0955-20130417/2106_1 /TAXON_ID=627963 /ORGANISM="Aplanochytrium sp, Strain PBS07" /LENGTH=113 /DNA_ID=CAMNT_0026316939 /DNA_START=499 /DNA_END=840 /DNA_ORIENTATION=+